MYLEFVSLCGKHWLVDVNANQCTDLDAGNDYWIIPMQALRTTIDTRHIEKHFAVFSISLLYSVEHASEVRFQAFQPIHDSAHYSVGANNDD